MRRHPPQARQDVDRIPCAALDLGTRGRVCEDCNLLQVSVQGSHDQFPSQDPTNPTAGTRAGIIELFNEEGLVPAKFRTQKR